MGYRAPYPLTISVPGPAGVPRAPHGTIRDGGKEELGTLPTTSSISHTHGSSSRCFAPTSSIRNADLQSFTFPITTTPGGPPPPPPPCTLGCRGRWDLEHCLCVTSSPPSTEFTVSLPPMEQLTSSSVDVFMESSNPGGPSAPPRSKTLWGKGVRVSEH